MTEAEDRTTTPLGTSAAEIVDDWISKNFPADADAEPYTGPKSDGDQPDDPPAAPDPDPVSQPEPVTPPEPEPKPTVYEHPDDVVRSLLNAGVSLRDIQATAPEVAARLAEKIASVSGDTKPSAGEPGKDAQPPPTMDADAVASAVEAKLQPLIERIAINESRLRLASEIPGVTSDASWGQVLTRARAMVEDVSNGRRPPFADMDGLLRAAARDVIPAVGDARTRAAPTPGNTPARADGPVGVDPVDAVLTEILDRGTLNVEELTRVAEKAARRA